LTKSKKTGTIYVLNFLYVVIDAKKPWAL